MGEGIVLVVGASGLVGRACVGSFRRRGGAIGTYHRRADPSLLPFDMTMTDAARDLVDRVAPRAVICAGADPHVEGCEADPVATRRINVEGTLRLAEAARGAGVPFVFFSSEYVFDGTAGPYVEEAPRHPVNEYGRQKAECEHALQTMSRTLVVRTSGVFGWNDDGKNFVLQLRKHLGRGERMRVPDDQEITPTYAPNLAEVVAELVDDGVTGIVHVAGARPMNRTAFARAAARVFGFNPALIDPTPTAAFGLKAARPLNAGLSTAKVASLARTPLLDPEEGLAVMREMRSASTN
jgi:dTDP-4-dehydrorhamnose reductase